MSFLQFAMKWNLVHRHKMRQNKKREQAFDAIKTAL